MDPDDFDEDFRSTPWTMLLFRLLLLLSFSGFLSFMQLDLVEDFGVEFRPSDAAASAAKAELRYGP